MKASKSPETQTSVESGERLNRADLEVLKAPFDADRLGVKVQSYNRERTRVMLVLYLQHTDVQDRIEQVDPAWTSEVVAEERSGDTVYVRSRLGIKGVYRENVGEGADPKAAYSDALKRCAMLFGIGRYLYDSPTVWADYDESRDKFRQWSVEDYDAALSRFKKPARPRSAAESASGGGEATPGLKTSGAPAAMSAAVAPKAIAPKAASANRSPVKPAAASVAPAATSSAANADNDDANARPREELNRMLLNLYRPFLSHFPQTQFAELLQSRYQVGETRLMSVTQLEDLVQHMQSRLQSVA